MKISRRIKFFSIFSLISIFIFISLFGIWIYQIDIYWTPILEPRLKERQSSSSIRIMALDSEGNQKWLSSLTAGRLEERLPLKINEVPPLLVQSIVVLEDPRFLEHGGFDITGILRAAVVNFLSLKFSQGGSTITQQLVKNVFLTQEKTLKRKITEIVLAALLENRFSKDEILEAYMNEVYLGQIGGAEIHGVGRGSEYYFGKKVNELELHEMALLAAMIAGPGYYSPWNAVERTRARRDRVLKTLADNKLILESELTSAMSKSLPLKAEKVSSTKAPYLLDAMKNSIVEEFGEINLLKGGFDIVLSLDLDLQARAEKKLLDWSQKLDPQNQALIVAADPQTCRIKTYVGGTQYSVTQLDRILQSKRPIGSLMKPLEIESPLSNLTDFHLSTAIDDAAFEWKFDSGRGKWKPENYDKKYRGLVSLRQTIENSLNVPLAKLFFKHYPNGILTELFDPLKAMGFQIPENRALPSALLGAIEQRPWDVLSAYVKLTRRAMGLASDAADLGCRLSFIHSTQGTSQDSEGETSSELLEEPFQFDSSRLVIAALEGAVRRGTSNALGAKLPLTQPWAGKTGSSSDLRDAWYVAVSPHLVLLVWTGRDDNGKTTYSGATGALPLVSDLILGFAEKKSPEAWSWPMPKNLEWRPVLVDRLCRPSETDEALLKSAAPEPSSTTPPPEVFEWQSKKYIYELFKNGSVPEICS
jgi:penicillin-binding protein 1B